MGEVVIKKFQCDRCHALSDRKPVHAQANSIAAHSYGEWAGGPVIEFKEMCAPCNDIIGKAVESLRAEALEARKVHG